MFNQNFENGSCFISILHNNMANSNVVQKLLKQILKINIKLMIQFILDLKKKIQNEKYFTHWDDTYKLWSFFCLLICGLLIYLAI